MSDELHIPIVEEEAHVFKHVVETERVTVRTSAEEEQVIVRDLLRSQQVEVTRIAKDQQVNEAPATRTEGDVTIIPVLEERLIIEKRLFLIEEVHLRRISQSENVEMPVTLRRTRVDVERVDLNDQESH